MRTLLLAVSFLILATVVPLFAMDSVSLAPVSNEGATKTIETNVEDSADTQVKESLSDSSSQVVEEQQVPTNATAETPAGIHPEQVPPEQNLEKKQKDFFAYSYSKRENSAITVVASLDVIYADSLFQKFQFQKSFKEIVIGLGVDISEDANELERIAGYIGFGNYTISIENAKLDGEFQQSGVTVQKFEDNKYIDVKFLKEAKNSGSLDFSNGLQIFSYERPSVLRQENTVFYDVKSQVTFLGYVIEHDSVKRDLTKGIPRPRHDWYFYTTTAFGLGRIKLSDETRKLGGAYAKPSEENQTFSGVGMNGEYELGYVYTFKLFSDAVAALKIGYNLQIEGPVMFDSLDFDFEAGGDVSPTEQFTTYGLSVSLYATF